MQKYQNAIQDVNGNAVAGATVAVYLYGTTTPATIYSDNGITPIVGNSVTTSSVGEFFFYAANGRYSLTVTAVHFTSDAYNDITLFDPTDDGAAAINFLQAGTGAVVRTVQAKERDTVSVKDFGAVGDGVTDDTAAIQAAILAGAGKTIYFPAGTYRIPYSASSCFSPLANTRILGDGQKSTTLQFQKSSAVYGVLFNAAYDNFSIVNVSVNIVEVSGGQTSVVAWNANNLTLESCAFSGGVTNTGATVNSQAYGVISPAGATTQTGLLVNNCSFTKFSWPFLKSNTAASIQKRLRITGNDFFSNYYGDISLNSPLGAISEVVISGNTLHDPVGFAAYPTVPYQLGIALASVSEVTVSGNTIIGRFGENSVGAFHIEENCSSVSISTNQVVTEGTNTIGLIALGNNVSGTYYAPSRLSISNNNFRFNGTASGSGSTGILVNTGTALTDRYAISANTIHNFETGIVAPTLNSYSYVIDGNVVSSCVYGMRVAGGGVEISRNVTSGCTYGVILQDAAPASSNISDHVFHLCTTTAYAGASGLPLLLVNPRFVLPLQTVGAGSTTNVVLTQATANGRIYGVLISSATVPSGGARNVQRADECTWDGATFTATAKAVWAPGSITLIPARSGTNFVAQLFCTNAESNVQIIVNLNGMISVRT